MTNLLQILIVLIVFGAVIYVLDLLPIDATVKTVIRVIAIVLVVIWALRVVWPMVA